MPSKISKTEATPVSFADWTADIAKRKREAGFPEMPRNSGNRRTQSKQNLLDALHQIGAKW